MDGRPHGKLLPRYAGPIAGFLRTNPDATRSDLIDFVSDTFGVRVSRIALYKFLKKYGPDQDAPPPVATPSPLGGPCPRPTDVARAEPAAPPFCSGGRSTRGPSRCRATPSTGWAWPATASATRWAA